MAGEVLNEARGLRIAQQTLCLRAEHGGLAQLAIVREREQLVVRRPGPQEITQARCHRLRPGTVQEQRVGRGERGAIRGLEGVLEMVASIHPRRKNGGVKFDLVRGHGTTKGPAQKRRQQPARVFLRLRADDVNDRPLFVARAVDVFRSAARMLPAQPRLLGGLGHAALLCPLLYRQITKQRALARGRPLRIQRPRDFNPLDGHARRGLERSEDILVLAVRIVAEPLAALGREHQSV